MDDLSGKVRRREPRAEVSVRTGYLKVEQNADPEPMYVEDLAALEDITEEAILQELYERLKMGHCHTFIGDVLLVLNPNENQPIYGDQVRGQLATSWTSAAIVMLGFKDQL